MDSQDESAVLAVNSSSVVVPVVISASLSVHLPSFDTDTSDTLIPTCPTPVDEGAEDREGLPSGSELREIDEKPRTCRRMLKTGD